nr:protein SPT2 homolog isoform X2 [Halyomorpha halys]
MLKSTKSANKSVMEDAIDNVNTAVTLGGFKQCDEDDYGYVSQEASAFYNKLLNKYEKMPNEPSIFSKPKKEVKDLNAAKDRVKAALQKEAEEEMMPHKRKKRKLDSNGTEGEEAEVVNEPEKEVKPEKSETKPKRKIIAPPPLKFDQLLQIAEKKQFEPIIIDENKLKKEPERLMTKKEKMEFERDEVRKLIKKKNPSGVTNGVKDNDVKHKDNKDKDIKEKDNKDKDNKEKDNKDKDNKETHVKKGVKRSSEHLDKNLTNHERPVKNGLDIKKDIRPKSDSQKNSQNIKEKLSGDQLMERLKKNPTVWAKNLPGQNNKSQEKKKTNDSNKLKIASTTSNVKNGLKPILKNNLDSSKNGKVKEVAFKEKELSDIDKQLELLKLKKEMLAEKTRLKKMELLKMKYASKGKKLSQERKPVQSRRRIGSDSEEEDSELEDFIDDDTVEDGSDYSKYISEIFGYDKSKYLNDDDEDECMESNFAQQMREEYVSTKIGIMEDLEDIRKEQEEKARKKQKMKKK